MTNPQGYLSEQDFDKLVSFANSERDRLLFHFLFYTGRRISEVVQAVTINDINFQDKLIRFRILKKRRETYEWLNVNTKLMASIWEFVEANGLMGNDFLFPITRYRADQIIKSTGKRAGLEYVGGKKLHAHTFRHSYAIHMAKQVKDIYELKKLQKLLGHSSINMTSFYTEHFNPEEMKEFVDRGNNDDEQV